LAEQIYQTKIKTPRIKVKNRRIPTKKSKIKELSTICPHAWIKNMPQIEWNKTGNQIEK